MNFVTLRRGFAQLGKSAGALVSILVGLALVAPSAPAQFGLPHMPGKKKTSPPDSSSTPPAPPTMPDMSDSVPSAAAPPSASAASSPGVPMAADSPVFAAFNLLQQHGSYHVLMMLTASGDQMQKAAASGFQIKGIEQSVNGDVHKSTMRYSMLSTDPLAGGKPDDWEMTGVVQGNKAAHLMYSPTATPRILKEADAKAAQQLAMMDAMFAQSAVKNAMSGPIGWAVNGVDAASDAASHIAVARMLKSTHDLMSWQCQSVDSSLAQAAQNRPPLTDLKMLGDDNLNGIAVTKYEFYVHEQGKVEGPIRMSVAKSTGLPARLEMTDPHGQGSMTMDYDVTTPVNIEIPDCMAKK
jgi:hypothetical protein